MFRRPVRCHTLVELTVPVLLTRVPWLLLGMCHWFQTILQAFLAVLRVVLLVLLFLVHLVHRASLVHLDLLVLLVAPASLDLVLPGPRVRLALLDLQVAVEVEAAGLVLPKEEALGICDLALSSLTI